MYDISHPHRLTTLPEFTFFESATAWLHIVQSITIGHPGLRCSNLDALRGRQDFIDIHPLGLDKHPCSRLCSSDCLRRHCRTLQQPIEREICERIRFDKLPNLLDLLLAAIKSFLLGVSTP